MVYILASYETCVFPDKWNRRQSFLLNSNTFASRIYHLLHNNNFLSPFFNKLGKQAIQQTEESFCPELNIGIPLPIPPIASWLK